MSSVQRCRARPERVIDIAALIGAASQSSTKEHTSAGAHEDSIPVPSVCVVRRHPPRVTRVGEVSAPTCEAAIGLAAALDRFRVGSSAADALRPEPEVQESYAGSPRCRPRRRRRTPSDPATRLG
jgi:hypothetical protein